MKDNLPIPPNPAADQPASAPTPMRMMNPVAQVQSEIAALLRAEPWFQAHRVEIVEQNRATVAYRTKTAISSIRGVLLVVGIDSFTNDHPALEMEVAITCTEQVTTNRAFQGYVSAIDAAQAAIQVIDGEWWHFFSLKHEEIEKGTALRATATFKGLVCRSELFAGEPPPSDASETN